MSGASEPPLLYNLKNEYDIDVIRLLGEYRGGFGRRGRVSGASEPPLLYNLKNEYHIDIRLLGEYRRGALGRRGRGSGGVNHHYFTISKMNMI